MENIERYYEYCGEQEGFEDIASIQLYNCKICNSTIAEDHLKEHLAKQHGVIVSLSQIITHTHDSPSCRWHKNKSEYCSKCDGQNTTCQMYHN